MGSWSLPSEASASFEYDGRARLLSKKIDQEPSELFRVDATSNYYEAGPGARPRRYDRGNVLLSKGEAAFEWNDKRQLVAKRIARPDGGEDAWRYAWNGQGLLWSVTEPDGTMIEFLYDPLGRRVLKRTWRLEADGSRALASTTRFVWDGEQVAHEMSYDGHGGAVGRTFAYGDAFLRPLAQRDLSGSEAAAGPWSYFMLDGNGAPEGLVAGDGRLVADIRRTAFGVTSVRGSTTTPLRFLGQYADEETGLHYNRYRYYDPDAGRYISPDPLDIVAGTNAFRYCPNPIGYADPLGLIFPPHTCSAGFTPAGAPDGSPMQVPDSQATRPGGGAVVPGFASGWSPNPQYPGRENNTREFWASHTERSAMAWARNTFPSEELNGGHLHLGGDMPPCTKCHKEMMKFSQEPPEGTGCHVHYNWPVGNSVTYSGGQVASSQGRGSVLQAAQGDYSRAQYQGLCQQQAAMAQSLGGGTDRQSMLNGFGQMRQQHEALGFGR